MLDGVEIVDDGWIEVHGITLVEGVNLAPMGNLNLYGVRGRARQVSGLRTLGCVRMNSPRAASRVSGPSMKFLL
jgi:hypothetical protein